MSSPSKYITFRNVDAMWSHENEIIFEGITYDDNELTSVSFTNR